MRKTLIAAAIAVLVPALVIAAGSQFELSDPTTGTRVNVNTDGSLQVSDISTYPTGAVAVTGASGNVANASAAATMAATAGKTNYVCGFTIMSTGATAAAVVSPTLTGVITGTLTYTYAAVAGATVLNTPIVVSFSRCVPASAVNTAITITLPALGAGNTNATTTIWGFRL